VWGRYRPFLLVDGVDELVDGVDEAGGPALSSARMEFRMFYWDTVVTNRASARQYFVKVMPRDFVG